MKKVLLIIGLLVALFVGFIAIVLTLVFGLTSGLTTTADSFFEAVREEDMQRARGHLSQAFRANTSEQQLQAFLASSNLTDVRSTRWTHRSIENREGELRGSATGGDGGVVPLTITLVKEEDSWKIYAIERPEAGSPTSSNSPPSVPTASEQLALVQATTAAFSKALDEGTMSHFYGQVSRLWQEQTSVDELDQLFSAFLEQGITLAVDSWQPQLDQEPRIDENQVLILVGHYPSQPQQLHFDYSYVQEDNNWALIGINVNLRRR